jgi:hypothetical protein
MKHVDMRRLPPAAQEERRRQVIGLRESGLTYEAIGLQVGLTRNGVFDICKRFRDSGEAGLQTGPRGPAPGTGLVDWEAMTGPLATVEQGGWSPTARPNPNPLNKEQAMATVTHTTATPGSDHSRSPSRAASF